MSTRTIITTRKSRLWLMRTGDMQIRPVNFQKRHREMLQWTYTLMSKRFMKIHSTLQKLIVSLRTAVISDEWRLDKEKTSHNDILDSFRLALCNFEPPKNALSQSTQFLESEYPDGGAEEMNMQNMTPRRKNEDTEF